MQIQKVDDAVAAFRYGIEVAPDEEISYLNLARVYARAGDRPRARDILHQLMAKQAIQRSRLEGASGTGRIVYSADLIFLSLRRSPLGYNSRNTRRGHA